MKEEIRKERIVFQGKIIEVVQEFLEINGKEVVFEKARRSPGVRMIIETPEGNFLLNKEKRHYLKDIDYRLPGGKVFDTLNEYNKFLKNGNDIIESAIEAVKIEALQEVGIEPIDIEYFYTSKAGATVEWDLIYFVVKNYKKAEQQLEEHEDIEIIEVSPNELKNYALSGKMQEDRSVAVILKYLNQKEMLY